MGAMAVLLHWLAKGAGTSAHTGELMNQECLPLVLEAGNLKQVQAGWHPFEGYEVESVQAFLLGL
jgi:hypothetical protein